MKQQLHLKREQEKTIQEIFQKAHERPEVNEEGPGTWRDFPTTTVQAIIKRFWNPDKAAAFEKMPKNPDPISDATMNAREIQCLPFSGRISMVWGADAMDSSTKRGPHYSRYVTAHGSNS